VARRPRAISAEIDIAAPRDVVWAILRDFDAYPEWNPFTTSVTTTLEPGANVEMQVRLRPPKSIHQVEFVSKVVEGEQMSLSCWIRGSSSGELGWLAAEGE
jgi:uncharacterized protein YndB with AHSA1/START domain